jgi:hypothetical protein
MFYSRHSKPVLIFLFCNAKYISFPLVSLNIVLRTLAFILSENRIFNMTAKWVTKKNGDLEKFSKTKLIQGMRKSGCGVKDAEWITKKVSAKCYDKISTRKIGLMVVAFLRKEDPKAAVAFNKFFTKNWRHL